MKRVKSRYKIGVSTLISALILSLRLILSVAAISVFYLTNSDSPTYLTKAESDALEAIDYTVGEKVGTDGEASLFITYSGGEGKTGYYFNREFYMSLPSASKRKVMNEFVESLKNQPMNTADVQVVYNALRDVGDTYVTAEISELLNSSQSNMVGAVSFLKPLTGPIGLILGVLTLLIMIGLVGTTVIDLCCIGIPFLSIKSDGQKPKLMTNDAFKAVKEATDGNGNAYWLYFKRRSVTYVVLLICIIFLLTGKLGNVFAKIVELFS